MDDYDYPDFPVILGYGSCSTLGGRPEGKLPKKRPIGFALPKKRKGKR